MRRDAFSRLFKELNYAPKEAVLSDIAALPNGLRNHVELLFAQPGTRMFACPVFEPMFGWKCADKKFDDLKSDLIPKSFVDLLDKSKNYGFSKHLSPYTHQLKSWETLLKTNNSVVVASGTGSGKTEAFMIPVLSDMIRQTEETGDALEGVQAIFLYPLNALIQSQKERFRAWTSPYKGKIRYCLYNGNLPEKLKHSVEDRNFPEEVLDRERLWQSPPPLLITNPTMLEYMLIRKKDNNILKASQGKLKYIILDEAHTYIGSQAAELALLLKRVLAAFGVSKETVKFIASSATIGGDDATGQLKRFLASIAGVDEGRIEVVFGSRHIEHYNDDLSHNETLTQLENLATDDVIPILQHHKLACEMREFFVDGEKNAIVVRDLEEFCARFCLSDIDGLRWLELLSSKSDKYGSFLPLRAHLFHKTFPGIWCCCNKHCSHKPNIPDWEYGKVYLDERYVCDCGAPVFKLSSCSDCGAIVFEARHIQQDSGNKIIPDISLIKDDFELNEENAFDENESETSVELSSRTIYIDNTAARQVHIDKKTGIIQIEPTENTVCIGIRPKEGKGCPYCGETRTFCTPFQGAPFFLSVILPILLSYAEPTEKPTEHPAFGKKMICFTDSRQGTAKTAIKLQQNAENNSIRSLLLDAISKETKVDEALQTLKRVLGEQHIEVKKYIENHPQNGHKYSDIRNKLMAQRSSELMWIYKYYADKDPDLFSASNGLSRLLDILFYREFARRPKRSVNMETLGLLSLKYDFSSIQAVPVSIKKYFSLSDWKDLLKIFLDYFVRANGCIEYPAEGWLEWGASFNNASWLEAWGITAPPSMYAKVLPRIKHGKDVVAQPQFIKLLSFALDLELPNPANEDILDEIVHCVWLDLTRTGILRSGADNKYKLDLTSVILGRPESVYKCPITKKPVDVTLKGWSPYTRLRNTPKCEKFDMPLYDYVGENGLNFEQIQDRRTDWLYANPNIQTLRNNGIWNNIANKVILGSNYYRTAEHSAQQSPEKLRIYEDMFKRGDVNILNCSTTMEMGIDIGGLSIVSMNNVPPHPANYLQRAGRAGRRKESKAIAMTICKNNSHEDYVFTHPKWAFETQIKAPYVDLFSETILWRHINSVLLASFFKSTNADIKDGTTLNMKWLMLPEKNNKLSEFSNFCSNVLSNDDLQDTLQKIIENTNFEEKCLSEFTERLVLKLNKFSEDWFAIYNALQEQMCALAKSENSAALSALENQRRRIEGEYVLKEFIEAGILPRYGFPINLVTFSTYNNQEARKQKSLAIDREDNLFRRLSSPTRDVATAIREYAPGAEVVIDGVVYKSEGITLNWHIPVSNEEVKEIQNLRHVWYCKYCGASGTSHSKNNIICKECKQVVDMSEFEYIQPAGFSVDFDGKVSNRITENASVRYYAPLVSVYKNFTNWHGCRHIWCRSSDISSLINYSKGTGSGYDLCLTCGRMSRSNLDDLHKRLRTGTQCKHSSFSLRSNVCLGIETTTDALELVFADLDGSYIDDEILAYTLGVAVRASVAAFMGVELEEVGCVKKKIRIPHDKGTCFSIVLFDNNASGYCSSPDIVNNLAKIMRDAKRILNCDCSMCCDKCLLQYDTRFNVNLLDRHVALQFLSEEWLQSLEKEL